MKGGKRKKKFEKREEAILKRKKAFVGKLYFVLLKLHLEPSQYELKSTGRYDNIQIEFWGISGLVLFRLEICRRKKDG